MLKFRVFIIVCFYTISIQDSMAKGLSGKLFCLYGDNKVKVVLLSTCTDKHPGIPPVTHEEYVWLVKSANRGDLFAQQELAIRHYWGLLPGSMKANDFQFEYWGILTDSTEIDLYVYFLLTVCPKRIFDIHYKPLISNLIRRANTGDVLAQMNLGIAYALGQGLEKNNKEAFKWLLKAAQKHNIIAQNNIAGAFATGDGTKQSDADAFFWYRLAADEKYPIAQFNLGLLYHLRQTFILDAEERQQEIIRCYENAAAQGLSDAQNNLGMLYSTGEGVAQDHKKAVELFKVAAIQSNADAFNNLGVSYALGEGVECDEQKAIAYFKKAIELGHRDAQENLESIE